MYAWVVIGLALVLVLRCALALAAGPERGLPKKGKPNYAKIERLEVELGIAEAPHPGWTGVPGEVIEYAMPNRPTYAVTRAMTDADVEASRRHRRYDDEAQQTFDYMMRITG